MSVDDRKVVLRLENVSKTFFGEKAEHETVRDISFEVYDNEFLVLLGPGHCGKTVLLNMIAGLLNASSGRILLGDEAYNTPRKEICMVFQKTGIMPWRTVMQNVELGLQFAGMDKKSRRAIAQKNIDLVQLTGFENAFPAQLSGGMKQRVGIARAYTCDPRILLMDEPFGALDAQTRIAMEEELERIWERDKRTILFVTNNIEEAVYLGDRIILLSQCPAAIKQIYSVDLPRPRNFVDRDFLRLRQEISDNADLSL